MSIHSVRARLARAGLHRPVGWLRNLGLHPNDVFIASHGRSGDTMLRFILGEILSGTPTSFDNIQQIVPEIGVHSKALALLPGNGRLIKTHELYSRKYKRAIYLIRDVRDAMLSFFARETAVGCIHPAYRNLDDYIPAFLHGKVTHFGRWQEHVEGWMNSPLAQRGDLLLVRFEDMRQDPELTIARCLDFLGRSADPSVVQDALQNNSLERMRAKENEAKKFPKSPGEQGRQVGRGAVEGWRQRLTRRQLEIVDECAGHILARFGYATEVPGSVAERRPRHPAGVQLSMIPAVTSAPCPWQVPYLRADKCDSANRPLHVRLGGRIANLFSWYRY